MVRATHVRDIAQCEHRPNRAIRSFERGRSDAYAAFVAACNLTLVALQQPVTRRTLAESHCVAAIGREEVEQLLADERGMVASKKRGGCAIGVGDAIMLVGGQDAIAKRIE